MLFLFFSSFPLPLAKCMTSEQSIVGGQAEKFSTSL